MNNTDLIKINSKISNQLKELLDKTATLRKDIKDLNKVDDFMESSLFHSYTRISCYLTNHKVILEQEFNNLLELTEILENRES